MNSPESLTLNLVSRPAERVAAEAAARPTWQPRTARRRLAQKFFFAVTALATLSSILILFYLLNSIWQAGSARLSWSFLDTFPSRFAAKAGIKAALWGSAYLAFLTIVFAIPVGIGAAVYLEEFATNTRLKRFIDINIANLAGVPSIVYGMLGLAVFVRFFALGRSLLAGALTMSLLVLPIIIVAAREALKAVPNSVRLAAFALGATRWQGIKAHVLPAAMPGILTGAILAMSRAVGETAPLLVIGAASYIAFVPVGPFDAFTALPIQIFNWTARPQEEFHTAAAAAILVLLMVLLTANAAAIWLRSHYQRKIRW